MTIWTALLSRIFLNRVLGGQQLLGILIVTVGLSVNAIGVSDKTEETDKDDEVSSHPIKIDVSHIQSNNTKKYAQTGKGRGRRIHR